MKVLISDDNVDYCSTVADILQSIGFETHSLYTPNDTIDFLEKYHEDFSLLLLDIEFGPGEELNGLDVLEHCRLNFPDLPVIMISGKGTIETAVKATKLGAINFIEKNLIGKEKLEEIVRSATENIRSTYKYSEIKKFLQSMGIIAKSKIMLEIGDMIVKYGRTDLNVLITGDTGTGKKLVAKAIHIISRRAKAPFITVDIPNIPRELFQSELFGHNKGSFSGAMSNKLGLFHQADNGTLFLDEIGDLSLDLQSSLLVPVEEKIIRKVGSNVNEQINVRFISATDKDLLKMMNESKFREQLYHRLRDCEIQLPPLSSRVEDIPDIIEYYTQKHNIDFNQSKHFSPATIEFLQEQQWPGNVRELASTIKVVLQTSSKDLIDIQDVYNVLITSRKNFKLKVPDQLVLSPDKTLKEDLEKVDKKKIESVLMMFKGNVSKAAYHLGVSRETLHNRIRKYEINVQLYREKKHSKRGKDFS